MNLFGEKKTLQNMSQKMLFGTVRSGKIMFIYDSFYTPYATP